MFIRWIILLNCRITWYTLFSEENVRESGPSIGRVMCVCMYVKPPLEKAWRAFSGNFSRISGELIRIRSFWGIVFSMGLVCRLVGR